MNSHHVLSSNSIDSGYLVDATFCHLFRVLLNSHQVASTNSIDSGYLVDPTLSTFIDGSFVTLQVFSACSEDIHVLLIYS